MALSGRSAGPFVPVVGVGSAPGEHPISAAVAVLSLIHISGGPVAVRQPRRDPGARCLPHAAPSGDGARGLAAHAGDLRAAGRPEVHADVPALTSRPAVSGGRWHLGSPGARDPPSTGRQRNRVDGLSAKPRRRAVSETASTGCQLTASTGLSARPRRHAVPRSLGVSRCLARPTNDIQEITSKYFLRRVARVL